MKRRYSMILAMALCALTAPSWSGELLVIGAEGTNLGEGDIVDGATSLSLPAGARLTLIAEDGTAVTLEGPYDGAPLAEAPESGEERTLFRALGTLFAGGGGQQGATKGATRGGPGGGGGDDPWRIDTATQGDACARAGGPATLWRAKSDRASSLKLTHKNARTSAEVEWRRRLPHPQERAHQRRGRVAGRRCDPRLAVRRTARKRRRLPDKTSGRAGRPHRHPPSGAGRPAERCPPCRLGGRAGLPRAGAGTLGAGTLIAGGARRVYRARRVGDVDCRVGYDGGGETGMVARTICALALFLIPLGGAQAALRDIDFGRYHALVIGINDYQNYPSLETAVDDATTVGELLRDKYGFEITWLYNPDRDEVVKALDALRGTLTERDNLLVYGFVLLGMCGGDTACYLRPATPGPARARRQECLAPAAQRTWSRSMRPPYRSAP